MFKARQITLAQRNQSMSGRTRYFDEGLCMFHVINVIDTCSQKGNDMLVIEMQVWDNRGKEGVLKEYILDHPDFDWKLHDFLDSINLSDMYLEGGTFDLDRIRGQAGKFILKYKKDKDGEEQKNIKYVIPMPEQTPPPISFNDDIPF
jgi:hypothetical protein